MECGGDASLTDLAGFLLKMDFTRKYTDGPKKKFRSLILM